jgi:hypothetical protein
MSTLVLEKTRVLRPDARGAARVETLESLVTAAWAQLRLSGHSRCPACGAEMRTVNDAGGAGPIGHCAACGSQLS